MNPKPDLGLRLAGIDLANPVLVASGTFGYAQDLEDVCEVHALGGVMTKAITLAPRDGNPTPRIAETPGGMLNAIGLANVGVEAFIVDKLPWLARSPARVFVNVAGSAIDEYVAVIERLESAEGIDGYELNISCPNVKAGGIAFGADPKLVEQVVGAAVKASSRPVVVKLSPNVADITVTAKAAEAAGAAALSLINTLIGMAIDVRTRKPILSNITGGLSGPCVKPVGLAQVYKTYQAVKIPLIGIGGITSTTDAIEYLMAGARAVQIGTGTFIEPDLAGRMVHELADWCTANRVSNPQDIVGAAHA